MKKDMKFKQNHILMNQNNDSIFYRLLKHTEKFEFIVRF